MRHRHHLALLVLLVCAASGTWSTERPNIVRIISEGLSAHFGGYGETDICTPHVDRLAAEGVRFSRAYVTAPICSTSRSVLITGICQTTIGAVVAARLKAEVMSWWRNQPP